ncbi:MAG: hypothetical protein EOQ28_31145 [Mesorhizobium sp.]|nr:MAG: hypothetical protein EOQ28_31145 [Mesorhizobium sp.]
MNREDIEITARQRLDISWIYDITNLLFVAALITGDRIMVAGYQLCATASAIKRSFIAYLF